MWNLITWGGLAYLAYLLLKGKGGGGGGDGPFGNGGNGGGGKGVGGLSKGGGKKTITGPCQYDPADRNLTRAYADEVMNRVGNTLLEKTPYSVVGWVQEKRTKAGVPLVSREFRDQDPYQDPVDWGTNQVYWAAYPKGPEKIPDANHPCAPLWLRIREDLRDDLRTRGLL